MSVQTGGGTCVFLWKHCSSYCLLVLHQCWSAAIIGSLTALMLFLALFWKEVCSKRKEFASKGANSFHLEKTPSQKGVGVQESKQKATKNCKRWQKIYQMYWFPLTPYYSYSKTEQVHMASWWCLEEMMIELQTVDCLFKYFRVNMWLKRVSSRGWFGLRRREI